MHTQKTKWPVCTASKNFHKLLQHLTAATYPLEPYVDGGGAEGRPSSAKLRFEDTPKDFFVGEGRQPSANETEEARLAKELDALAKLPHSAACARVLELEKEHGKRREWVWAKIGQSPLALALQPLARLAQAAQRALGGADLASIIKTYAEDGWQCDDAANRHGHGQTRRHAGATTN